MMLDIEGIKRMQTKERCILLKEMIENACIATGLNLCVYEGKIGFVDQEQMKIVALCNGEYDLSKEVRSVGEADSSHDR